jgi:two-component system nitrogen regulation response regulator NtrX
MAQILIVDDEMGIRELLSEILADEGHSVWLAENADSGAQASHRQAARSGSAGHLDA